jgi:molecular chaperone GrpE (heat shock protein)
MTEIRSRLPLWPFFVVDLFLVGTGGVLLWLGHRPLLWWEAAAGSFIFPFARRNHDDQALAQAKILSHTSLKLQQIDQLAAQISGATSQWREYHEQISQNTAAAKAVAASMSAETQKTAELLQKSNDVEKGNLRLEVEKLRKAEAEWIQIIVYILDHVFAMFQAANRSGQPGFMEQMGLFQNSCREAARRIGLVATLVKAGDPYDPNLHKLVENATPNGNSIVAETLATGYTFQGQIIRRPLVALTDATP